MAAPKHHVDFAEIYLDKGVDLTGRRLFLDEDVDETIIGFLVRGLHLLETKSNEPITVFISTTGGDCYAGLALYDALCASPCEIITVGMGRVMSMGTILLLAGDKRLAYPNTSFLWHSVASDAADSEKLFSQETNTQETKRVMDILVEIYGERSKQPASFWRRWLRYEDRYDGAVKAVELGFVHEIIPHKVIAKK